LYQLQSCSPAHRLSTMVLDRDDDQEIGSRFVDYAVRKTMDLATPHALREWSPGFGIILYAFYCFFDFVGKLKTQSRAGFVVVGDGLMKFRIRGVEISYFHLPRCRSILANTSSAGTAPSSPRSYASKRSSASRAQ